MVYNIIVILISMLIPAIILRNDWKKEENIKAFTKSNKLAIILYLIFTIGFLVRLVGIVNHPNGLNTDEASIGYEAYSVVTYGIDRNGNSWPVFLESWGSGQNTLYMYIIMPFVKIMGLSKLSVRLPMAIIGCISLFVMFKLLKKCKNEKFATIGLAFLAITPWHIMKSRYGLESNVFPEFALYAAYFILSAFTDKKPYKMYIGAVFLGLCSYAYGTSYFFLPVFVIILLIVFLIKKDLKLKTALIFLTIIAIISLPIILMIFINTFNYNEIKIGPITIPRLEENRYETLTVLSSGNNIIIELQKNFIDSLEILLLQNDEFNINALPFFGIVYTISPFFIVIGIFFGFRSKDKIDTVFKIWLCVAFLLIFICEPNINRMNILYFPIIYFCIFGIHFLVDSFASIQKVIIFIYIATFICFLIVYFNTDFTKTFTVVSGVENIIEATNNVEADNIYFEYSFKEPQIYICFFNKINTREYVETVRFLNNMKTFGSVREFGRYKLWFKLDNIDNEGNNCYVMRKDKLSNYNIDESIWKITYIDDFCMLEKQT